MCIAHERTDAGRGTNRKSARDGDKAGVRAAELRDIKLTVTQITLLWLISRSPRGRSDHLW